MIRVVYDAICTHCEACLQACQEAIGPEPRLFFIQSVERFFPVICRQCKTGSCMEACPTGALALDGEVVWFSSELCLHCGLCVLACPTGAMILNSLGEPIKCTDCPALDQPVCVLACPEGCLEVVKGRGGDVCQR